MYEGEILEGTVMRLPTPGTRNGNRAFIFTNDGLLGIPATARKGHSVLERELPELEVRVGDDVVITYNGMRNTADGERRYRHYTVERRGS